MQPVTEKLQTVLGEVTKPFKSKRASAALLERLKNGTAILNPIVPDTIYHAGKIHLSLNF